MHPSGSVTSIQHLRSGTYLFLWKKKARLQLPFVKHEYGGFTLLLVPADPIDSPKTGLKEWYPKVHVTKRPQIQSIKAQYTCLAPAPRETYRVDCNTAEMWTMFILTIWNYMYIICVRVCYFFLYQSPAQETKGVGRQNPWEKNESWKRLRGPAIV